MPRASGASGGRAAARGGGPSGAPGLTARVLAICFLRTYLVGAAFNRRGMQNVGLTYAMEPGLAAIYPDPRERHAARKRYLSHYNTHMFWTPLLVGVFLKLESKIARGLFPREVLENLKNTTAYTLSAIGDSVFGGSLLVFWSLSTSSLLVAGYDRLALGWALGWFVSLHVFKAATFLAGVREGLKVLQRLKRWDLINWGHRLKVFNGLLMTLVLYQVWPGQFAWLQWAVSVSVLAAAAVAVVRLHLSREIMALIILGIYAAYPWLAHLVRTQLLNG
ncbi:MAG: PTS system mannose/fructose/sorbose family transporter subunit IID [Desulfovibrionaceae bacterium]|nr:PTS system mannose/fructose/sorbose family transporter subunit IID [Desulfovibrionaceae bacterium]